MKDDKKDAADILLECLKSPDQFMQIANLHRLEKLANATPENKRPH